MLILPAFTDAHQHTAQWPPGSNCLLNISVQWLGETFNPSLTLKHSLGSSSSQLWACRHPSTDHLAAHTVLFPKCCCTHVVAAIILKEMSVWKLCFGADAVELQAWIFPRHPCCMWTLLCSRANAMVQAGGWQPGGVYQTKVMGRTKLAAFNWGNKRAHIQQSLKKIILEKKRICQT